MTHCSEVIFQFPKQTIIESFKTRKNTLHFTSEKRKLKWPFEVLINDISSSIGFAFRSFVISVLKDKTIICSDNRPRQSSFSDSLLEQKSKNRDQSALFIISRLLYTIYMGYSVGSRIGCINVTFSSQNRIYHFESQGNRNYLFRGSVAPGSFPLQRPEKSCFFIYFPSGSSPSPECFASRNNKCPEVNRIRSASCKTRPILMQKRDRNSLL